MESIEDSVLYFFISQPSMQMGRRHFTLVLPNLSRCIFFKIKVQKIRLARHLQLGEELSSKQEKLVLCSTVTVRSNERERCFPYHLSRLNDSWFKNVSNNDKNNRFCNWILKFIVSLHHPALPSLLDRLYGLWLAKNNLSRHLKPK